jgi:hypothetical protein
MTHHRELLAASADGLPTASSVQLYWFSNITSVESFATFNALTGFAYGGGFILYAAGAALFLALQVQILQTSYKNILLDLVLHALSLALQVCMRLCQT